MKTLQAVKDKITIFAVKHNIVAWGMGAYIFAGMQNLSDFITDMVTLLPSIIPLVVVGVILAVVIKFGGFIKQMLSLK